MQSNLDRSTLARVNRLLASRGQIIRRCPVGSRDHHELGDFYLVDVDMNAIVDKDVDLVALERNLRVAA